jgi:ribonuclease HII
MYSWKNNKGYGTPDHRSAIEQHGLCQYHRKSFNIFAAKLHMDEEALSEIEQPDTISETETVQFTSGSELVL